MNLEQLKDLSRKWLQEAADDNAELEERRSQMRIVVQACGAQSVSSLDPQYYPLIMRVIGVKVEKSEAEHPLIGTKVTHTSHKVIRPGEHGPVKVTIKHHGGQAFITVNVNSGYDNPTGAERCRTAATTLLDLADALDEPGTTIEAAPMPEPQDLL